MGIRDRGKTPQPKDAQNTTASKSKYISNLRRRLAIQREDHVELGAMGKESGVEGQQQSETPPSVRLHKAIEETGAYQHLNPVRARILRTYLSEEQTTMSDIQRAEGFRSKSGVHTNIHTSLERIFPLLPEEVQEEYRSAKDAIKTKSAHHTESSKQRIRQGLDRLKRPDAEKIEFSDTHKQNLSEALSQRWQREREARREAQQSTTSPTDLIKKLPPGR